MGYGLMLYGASQGALKSFFGSKDERAKDRFLARRRYDIQRFDEHSDDQPMSMEVAITQLFLAEPLDPKHGSLYGYAFKMFCEEVGRFLFNNPVYPCSSGYLDQEVNPALKNMGVADLFKITDFAFRYNCPFAALPYPDDFPGYGYFSPEEVKKIHQRLSPAQYKGGDDQISDIIEVAKEWFATCAMLDWALVGFYH